MAKREIDFPRTIRCIPFKSGNAFGRAGLNSE